MARGPDVRGPMQLHRFKAGPEHMPQVDFLQVMHIVAFCSMPFSTFSGEI